MLETFCPADKLPIEEKEEFLEKIDSSITLKYKMKSDHEIKRMSVTRKRVSTCMVEMKNRSGSFHGSRANSLQASLLS